MGHFNTTNKYQKDKPGPHHLRPPSEYRGLPLTQSLDLPAACVCLFFYLYFPLALIFSLLKKKSLIMLYIEHNLSQLKSFLE